MPASASVHLRGASGSGIRLTIMPPGREAVIRMNYDGRMAAQDHEPPAPGPYLQTVSGRWVNPFNPDPEQLDAGDIARALANQCRFGGHSRAFYSVAQHSTIVSDVCAEGGASPAEALSALMHDAGEAYLVDLPHPLKHRSDLGPAYRQAEKLLEAAIGEGFDLVPQPAAMKPDMLAIPRAIGAAGG